MCEAGYLKLPKSCRILRSYVENVRFLFEVADEEVKKLFFDKISHSPWPEACEIFAAAIKQPY
jgi:hypothetical protein